jgi:hypothetical protein
VKGLKEVIMHLSQLTSGLRVVLVAALLLAGAPGGKEAAAQVEPTAYATIQGLRGVLNGVIAKARAEAQMLLADAAVHANGMLDRTEKMLGDNVRKPLAQLDQTVQNEIAAARSLVQAIKDTADQLPMCIGNEADIAISSLKSGVQSALGSVPFVKGAPIAFLVQQPSTRSPYVVLRDPNNKESGELSLIVRGANLWIKGDVCEVSAEAVPFDKRQSKLALSVKSTDLEKVVLGLSPTVADGEWLINVNAQRPGAIMGCRWPSSESVSAGIKVTTPTAAAVTVEVTPACKGYSECSRHFDGSCTNGSTRDDKNCTHTFEFQDAACEYVRVDNWEKGGRDGNVANPRRSGNTIIISSTGDRRSRTRGGTSRVWYRGVMIGRKAAATVVQDKVAIPLAGQLRPGSSAAFHVAWQAPQACEVHSFTLGGQATFGGDRRIAFPEQTVASELSVTSVVGGMKATLNALTRRGTVEFLGGGCLAK